MSVEIKTSSEDSGNHNLEASNIDWNVVRAKFDNLYSHSSEAVVLCDPFQLLQPIVACNDAFARMNGYSQEELIGQSICIFHIAEPDLDRAMEYQLKFVNDIKREGAIHGRDEHVCKDGQTIYIEYSVRIFSIEGHDFLLSVDKLSVLGTNLATAPVDDSIFQLLFKYSEAAVVITEPLDTDWTILDCNVAYADLVGFQREELIGQPLGDFSMEQDPKVYESWMRDDKLDFINNLRTFGSHSSVGLRRCKDQTLCDVNYTMSLPIIDGHEKLLVEVRNLTPMMRARQLETDRNRVLEMIAQDEELSATLEQIASMSATQIEPMECAIFLNREGVLHIGAAPHQSKEFYDFFSELSVNEAGPISDAMQQRMPLFVADSVSSEQWRKHHALAVAKQARCCWVLPFFAAGQLSGALVLYGTELRVPKFNELEFLDSALRLCEIAVEQHAHHERVAHQARHDFLTGLPNRLLFEDRLNHALETSQRSGEQLALLFIDLDGFKQVNDTLGHEAGDVLLQQVAQRLQGVVRRSDTVGRLGGDEFTVLLYGINYPENVVNVLPKILEALQAPMEIMAQEVFVTASIGVAVSPYHGSDSRTLMHNADAAMYRAKERGKNTYELFDDSIGQAVKQRLDLKKQLRYALERDEFEIYYQPQFALDQPSANQTLSNPKLLAFEALLRWRHPKIGLVLPLSFIPAAEESGIIFKIGTWVIERACEQLRNWRDAGFHDLQVAVNVSALQFGRAEFLDVLTHALKINDLKPSCLGLELTESVIMSNVAEVERQLIRVRRLGVDIIIDDFGTGYSSLSYLQKLPITHLKIDGSFVHGMHPGQTDSQLLESIITLAHSLDLRVIAEGVEHPEELRLLQCLNCDGAQGDFLARPMNTENATLFLKSQHL